MAALGCGSRAAVGPGPVVMGTTRAAIIVVYKCYRLAINHFTMSLFQGEMFEECQEIQNLHKSLSTNFHFSIIIRK